ncbi:uncharacterized protein PF11_0213-like [Chrysoperla carnea]|uniref:uncharacterized protein PF11_0213-like n=1 Tax=Chrysoperla carnea TaxID=189513 RepID=UPI001D078FD8|nr:uncharacterized protein PF11_0213-like [Chrysoperla carnea]
MPPPPPPPPAPKECEENLRMRITFKKVSKLNSTIGLQLTDFENVQIITTPKADTIHSAQKSTATATPSKSVSHNPDEETDEERSLPLAERTFLQKPKLPSNTDDKNVFQFKQPGLPFSRAKRRNTLPAVFSAVDETTDEEADVPLAQRFGIKKPVFNSNAAEETEDEDRIIPLAERLEKLRKKTEIPSYKNSSAAEETEDEDRIIPLAERLAKLRQLQVAKSLHMKLPDPADETEDEDRILPLAERIARENKKQLETESLKTKINLKKLPVDPAEETEDEERIIPLAERIAKLNKAWQESEAPKPTPIAAIPNPADETEDEERIIPLALRIAKKKETVADAFQFKEPEIPELLPYQKKRKTVVPPAIFTPADETTDEEGDVPLARRFGLPKPLEENIKKRKNSLDESSSTKLEITELQSRKRRKSLSTTLDINEPSIDCTKIHVENTEKSKTIDVFDFNEPDSPVSNSLGDVRNKSKIQNIEELSNKINSKLPTKIIIETTPKKITTKLHADKQKKSSVKKIFKIRKKRRKGKLKFTNRRYKKVLSKIIIEEPEIIEHIPEIEAPIPIEESIKNTPDFESIDTIRSITPPIVENDNLEKTTENIEDDDEASRNSSLGGGDDGFDNRTDVSSLSDTTVPEPSEAVILERHSPLLLRIKTNFKAKGKRGRPPVKKISIAVDNTENYCEICNKHFCRADNLIKHKMTFTHIAKLSELEAKESEKRRLEERQEENVEAIPTTSSGDNKENNTTPLNDNNMTDEDDDDDVFEESSNFGNDVASRDLDELAMKFIVRKNRLMDDDSIGNSDEASSSTDAFNLGNGVNYPDLVTSHQPKRYRSLGERKSFDSNQSILSPDHQLLEEQNSPQIPDSIIQEDDEDEDNESNHEIEPSTFEIPPTQEQSRPKSQNNVVFDYLKKSSDHPTSSTFEFISQTNQFEENFTRKKLNRDEELFLECCSLLKNNSKSRKIFDGRNNDLQPQSSSHHVIANSVEESTAARIDDWSNSNSVASDWLSQKGGSTTSNNNTSFNKRGQSTNMSSFKFNTMSNTAVDDVDGTVKNKPQNFEEIPFKSMALNVNEYMDFSNINVNQGSEHQKDSSKEKDDFSEINSLLSTSSETSVGRSSIHDERSLSNSTTSNEDSLNNSDDLSDFCGSKQDDSTVDSKKIPTKGALKIFEGIKVSIPTQEINLAEVLSSTQNKILQIDNQQQNIDDYDDANSKKLHSTNSNSNSVDSHSLKLYKNGVEVSQSILKTKKSSSSHIDKDDEEESTTILSTTSSAKRSANKSGTKKKITKSDKKSTVSTAKTKSTQKTKDIYDFEDSQDEFEVDQQLNFKTYRDQKLFSPNDTKDVEPPAPVEANVVENNSDSDDDHHDYIDSFSVDESSHSSDEENTETTKIEPPPQQIKKAQNSVKGVKNENKKGMIMGRIFKHVVKSKTPEVGSSPNTKDANTLFDNLIGEKSNQETFPEPIAEQQQTPAPVVKKAPSANKTGKKPGKRTKPADSSSDDDFTLTRKPSKKINRRKKGNTNTKDENESGSGINLEQEIRECIGVAGRKSQRKCTSGKQNILVEFWSSDEMSDGEKRIKDSSENNVVDENNVNKENEKIEENLNNKPLSEPPTIENNPLNETIVNINDEKIAKPDNVKRKVIRNPKVAGGQGNGTTVTNAKRKPSRVQANKVSRKCSKIRNKTKARGRRKKLLPNNNNLDTQKNNHHQTTTTNSLAVTRRKRSASEKLYYWSSSSDDEFEDFIEVKPIRDDPPDDEDRPMHHGWIVGESPKKLVTMLAQAKGSKKVDAVYVKEQGKRNRVTL